MREMKCKIFSLLSIVLILLLCINISFAQKLDLNNYESDTFSIFTKALGTLLGNGLFHTAAVHSISGFDIGVKSIMIFIPDKDRRGPLGGVKYIPLPLFQADLGLHDNIEIGARYINIEFGDDVSKNVNIYTGIIKYGVFQTFGLPKISLVGAYSRLSGVDDFKMSTLTFSGVVSEGLPLITIYGGVSYNIYLMNASFKKGGLYTTDFSSTFKETDLRYTVGVSLGLIPFSKVNMEYSSGYFKSITIGILLSLR
ncbi:hypothetical protein DRQ09_06775 [candidate division KSB1 bacterium]|nr:MAG: hypothetical protein DRQ09_06775 [candidate division KSB1 bacterium]